MTNALPAKNSARNRRTPSAALDTSGGMHQREDGPRHVPQRLPVVRRYLAIPEHWPQALSRRHACGRIEQDRLTEAAAATAREILDTRASTPAGMMVKLRVNDT
ncbi:hypothetical protein [Mesorhizobium sp.]|uniref:hypothetical protein n=1 Tax=Mesorhizobium sp. TaxID=1871066 RepID=UPI000FE75187|nr:hypothetical protein [Mesorhizobium sp.]RWK46952.1 MAG: hypothetical protein EOR48_32855 [Mesorhizobium sp.]TIP38817.1 MAG: hypothetical protein E5X62_32730 [Mesorhizobium sp.]TIR29431.1 MAG: hypothetical protein E5X64_16945 [Mesorhizobium sp.]